MPVGIVLRKTPGVTRWAQWSWRVVGVLPGAGPASWQVLRREGDAVEYHAATLPLELWSSDTEAYQATLVTKTPSLTVIMHEDLSREAKMPWQPALITASAFETQDYADAEGYLIELVPMPPRLLVWVRDFVEANHVEKPFIKRKRDRMRVDLYEDGRGDARVRQAADVYRAPHPERARPHGGEMK